MHNTFRVCAIRPSCSKPRAILRLFSEQNPARVVKPSDSGFAAPIRDRGGALSKGLNLNHIRQWNWVLAIGLIQSQCLAQGLDTFLVAPNKPSARDAPAYISSVNHRVAIRGDYVYLADGYAGLGVYSLSDRPNPRLVGEYPTGEYAADRVRAASGRLTGCGGHPG